MLQEYAYTSLYITLLQRKTALFLKDLEEKEYQMAKKE